jgi:hypothetical protein
MIDRVANLNAIASATASRTEEGWRALDLRVWDGIDVRLLPDRGFDCCGAWYRGVPLAWVSAVGECGPISGRLRDDDWLTAFAGGLVTTCGLRNVGAPSEGHAMHGEISHQPARELRVERLVEGDQVVIGASRAGELQRPRPGGRPRRGSAAHPRAGRRARHPGRDPSRAARLPSVTTLEKVVVTTVGLEQSSSMHEHARSQ